MHHPYDDLAKNVGKGALAASGPTTVEHAISRSAQRADIRHDPDPACAAERARLGLLGRIAEVLCLIEVFGHAPDGGEWRGCLTKHFAHWEERRRRVQAQNRARKARGLDPEPFVKPMLWILAAWFSEPMLRKLKVRTRASFPKGVYFHGDDLHRVGVVVASELPRHRSTLLVRIMAAGPLLPDAIADLAELPEDAVERGLVEGRSGARAPDEAGPDPGGRGDRRDGTGQVLLHVEAISAATGEGARASCSRYERGLVRLGCAGSSPWVRSESTIRNNNGAAVCTPMNAGLLVSSTLPIQTTKTY